MPLEDRQRIAGLATAAMVTQDGVDWNYFGEMSNTKRFDQSYSRLVHQEPGSLLAALDQIPLAGPVTEDDWNAYWSALMEAVGVEGGIGRGTATRLACVKRPDVFVSVNNKSAKKLAERLEISPHVLHDTAHYWTNVIAPIRLTTCWSSNRPSEPMQAEAWDSRTALLDALVYDKDA